MKEQPDLDEFDIVIRRRKGRYVAKIPQLGLYATAETLHNTIEALEDKRKSLLEELIAADALNEIQVSPRSSFRQPRTLSVLGVLSALGMFAGKKVVIVLVLILLTAVTAAHVAHRTLQQATTTAEAQFWTKLKTEIDRASDPARDMPIEKKQALLAELRVIVDRWRPFVREARRLLSDEFETQPSR